MKESIAQKILFAVNQLDLSTRQNVNFHVAVSGGVDSVVLLDVLAFISTQRLMDVSLSVVHVNHMLRGEESNEDEAFVHGLAKKYQIPFYVKRLDPLVYQTKKGESIQVVARNERYKFFGTLQRQDSDFIVTAHHMNDQIETFIMRSIKGASLSGLCGIPRRRGQIIRPLIDVTGRELVDYYRVNQLQHREDSSNKKMEYTRNFVRQRIAPQFAKINPTYIETMGAMMTTLKRDDDLLGEILDLEYHAMVKASPGCYWWEREKFRKLHPALQFRFLDKLFKIDQLGINQVNQRLLANCVDLIVRGHTSNRIDLQNDVRLEIQYEKVSVYKVIESVMAVNDRDKLENSTPYFPRFACFRDGERVILPDDQGALVSRIWDGQEIRISREKNTASFDIDKLEFPLTLRYMEKGDVIKPLGMKGRKKLNRLFIDDKIPKEKRNKMLLLCYKDEILWILGHRISDVYKITSRTKRVVCLEWN